MTGRPLLRLAGRVSLFLLPAGLSWVAATVWWIEPARSATTGVEREATDLNGLAADVRAAAGRLPELAEETRKIEGDLARLEALVPPEVDPTAVAERLAGRARALGLEVLRAEPVPVEDREFYREARIVLELAQLAEDRLAALAREIHAETPVLHVTGVRLEIVEGEPLARLTVGVPALQPPPDDR